MLGALAHGLPQLILPQGADQFLNAEACEKVGAALSLAPDVFDAAAVARDASRLLGEPEFAEAAAGVAREIAGMASPRQVLASLSREHRRAA